MSSKFSKIIYPIATLSGTIIGVGIFSLPYVALKSGIWLTLVYFLILGALVVIIHYLFGEIALQTPDFLRLPGYAKIHLGKWGEWTAKTSTIIGFYGSILAYFVVGGEFLRNLLSPIFGGGNLVYTLFYFSLGAVFIFFGIKIISKVQFWALILFLLVLIIVFLRGFSQIKLANVFPDTGQGFFGFGNFFLPYGPILFSLWGISVIPEIEEMLGENKNLLKKLIPIGVLIPALIYLLFIFLILGITGQSTSSEAISGLKNFLGGVVGLAFLLCAITTFTSFLSVGLTLRNTFWYDFKMPKNLAWGFALFLPLFLFLVGFKDFIAIIGLVGGMMLGVDGILILLMYQKIKPERKFLTLPLTLIFLGGIIYEIIYFVK